MKNTGLFLLGFFSVFIFFFQVAAQNQPSASEQDQAQLGAETLESPVPVRAYPADTWYQKALDGQIDEVEFINYLYTVLLHPETSEDVWEDALNSVIYIKRKETIDTVTAAEVQERVYQLFAEVIADSKRTERQRKDILNIIASSGATSAVTILKEFVQVPFSDDSIDPDEERGLRRDAVSLIEDINIDSALQALYDLVLFEPLDVKLKEKALDSLEDRQAYTHIRQLVVNASVSSDMSFPAFQIIVEHGELSQHIKVIAMASSVDYEMRSAAVEALEKSKELALIREIALNPSVDDAIQEKAFLTLIALRKERQDRRQQ